MYKPASYTSVSPYLIVPDARATLDFAAAVFGAETLQAHRDEDGVIRHAEFRIDDSVLMVGQAAEPSPAHIHVYLADPDAAFARALEAGGTEVRPMDDQPDGDRRGGVTDPNGTTWWFARAPRL
jgi:PhnB protein